MPKSLKKSLPQDFEARLQIGDIAALEALFETCALDARGGYAKQTALAFPDCPEELMRWLVEEGADIEARDVYGRTPLHTHAADRTGSVETLLNLGADIHARDSEAETPLHKAVGSFNLAAARLLLNRGADAKALNSTGLTPLAAALQHCRNIEIVPMAEAAELLLDLERSRAGGLGGLVKRALSARPHTLETAQTRAFVRQIREAFEMHRAAFNPDEAGATSAALDRLYGLFGVPPVPRRVLHDGVAPIVAHSVSARDQHQELWKLLVPSAGPAETVQGEVVRITGRIRDEVDRNGGPNWDRDYAKMARAFAAYIRTRVPLSEGDLVRAEQLIGVVRDREGAGDELCEFAAHWVRLNPTPIPTGVPGYRR